MVLSDIARVVDCLARENADLHTEVARMKRRVNRLLHKLRKSRAQIKELERARVA